MARLNFRQGIVSHQTDSFFNPLFLDLTGGYVDLVVSPDPTIIAFVHDDTDYLYTESVPVSQAWGPIATGITTWIYWDLNLADGSLTRGKTTLEPIESNAQPPSPAIGQMWFKQSTRTWYEWSGSRFVEVIRVFAARIAGGITFQSMSINSPKFTGSQVGLTQKKRVGSLVFGKNNKPLRNTGTNKFFTTEDDFLTGVPTSAALRLNSILITGQAICPLAAYQVVEYNDYNKICIANPAQEGRRLFGIIEEDAATGEVVNFITEGVIFNEDWDWTAAGANINDPLYTDSAGNLTRLNPLKARLPVGLVIGRQEIFFAPRLFISVTINGGGAIGNVLTPAEQAQLNQATTTSTANAATLTFMLSTTLPDMVTATQDAQNVADQAIIDAQAALDAANLRVLRAGDTLTGKIFGPSTVIADPAGTFTTKDYVDQYHRGYQTAFLANVWVGSNPRSYTIPQGVHGLPLNTLYHMTVNDNATGKVVNIEYEVNTTSGLVTLYTYGAAFAGVIRIS